MLLFEVLIGVNDCTGGFANPRSQATAPDGSSEHMYRHDAARPWMSFVADIS